MTPDIRRSGFWVWLAAALIPTLMTGCLAGNPVADDSYTSKRLESLPQPGGPRKVVTIYEFRSGVPEISAHGATDMFTTALIKSGSFAVAERQRVNEGVIREKQMNAQGMTTGDNANQRLTGADYIFEGSVTEANANADKNGIAGTVRGLGVEASGAKAVIGLDLRVIDARTGLVLGAVNVRKPVKQGGVSVSGIGSFVQQLTKRDLQGTDVNVGHDSKEGVDEALRACIEEAIYQMVRRYGN